MPKAIASDVRRHLPHLLDSLDEYVERLLPVRSPPGPAHPVVHHQFLVDNTPEKLGPARIDPDHAPRWHGR